METLIGVIVGALATVLAARYYYLRSINKSLGVYHLLNSMVFAGITPDVRKQLHFRFEDREVNELQQIVFLVANDGERAVSHVVEPLTLAIPSGVELMDASILHRHPSALQVKVYGESQAAGESTISFPFPILNKGEFFVVKLLLSGRLGPNNQVFRILADDLPRTLEVKELPLSAIEDRGHTFAWGAAVAALVILSPLAWLMYFGYQLVVARPELFPYPWSSFDLSWEAILFLLPGSLVLLILALSGVAMFAAAFFGGRFPPKRGPRFPLPRELQRAVYRHPFVYFPSPFEEPDLADEQAEMDKGASNQSLQRAAKRRR